MATPEERAALNEAHKRGEVKRGDTITFASDSKTLSTAERWNRVRAAWSQNHPDEDLTVFIQSYRWLDGEPLDRIERHALAKPKPDLVSVVDAINEVVSETETLAETHERFRTGGDPKAEWKQAVAGNATNSGFAEWLREREEIALPKPGDDWEGNTVIASTYMEVDEGLGYYVLLLLTKKPGEYYRVVQFTPGAKAVTDTTYAHISSATSKYVAETGGY